jgi:hypothetical protein
MSFTSISVFVVLMVEYLFLLFYKYTAVHMCGRLTLRCLVASRLQESTGAPAPDSTTGLRSPDKGA